MADSDLIENFRNDEYINDDDVVDQIMYVVNRYYQEATITEVSGSCPYGHCKGDSFKVSCMNSDSICGSLLKGIFHSVIVKHYGGDLLWENEKGVIKGSCVEDGRVEVEIKRVERNENVLLKMPIKTVDMTNKGYPALDKYRLFVEVRDIAVNCYWGHKIGDIFEVDPFNVGGACSFLYAQLYPYMHVLLSGASPPWAFEEKTVVDDVQKGRQ